MHKTSRLVRISLLINALSKRVLLFVSGQLSYKSNRKLFSCAAYPDINTRGVGIIITGYANTENVLYCLIMVLFKCVKVPGR